MLNPTLQYSTGVLVSDEALMEAITDHRPEALDEFYKKFEKDLKRASKNMENLKQQEIPTDEVCEKCGSPMVIKWGQFGRFMACSAYPECKNTKEIVTDEAPKMSARLCSLSW